MEQQFTEEYFMQFIKDELSKDYYHYPAVRGMFELDDLVQDTVMWYYQPMRNGEQRLAHYLKLYEGDMPHFWNTLKYGLKQTIPALMRYNFMKNIPMSLNVPLDSDDESVEFLDVVPDASESIFSQVECTDTLTQIKNTLREENIKRIYKEAMKDNRDLNYMEFRLYPTTIIKVGSRTSEQLNIITDLLSGFKASELRLKYSEFDRMLNEIRTAFTLYYETHQTTVHEVLGSRKVA